MAWPLLQEHGYLGASIEDGRVVSYLNETPVTEALEGVALFDLTGACYRFISGMGAQSLVEALTASRCLVPGSCSFSAVLSGDGSVVSVPILVRGGEHEYVLVDPTPRREVLGGWLSFVSAIGRPCIRRRVHRGCVRPPGSPHGRWVALPRAHLRLRGWGGAPRRGRRRDRPLRWRALRPRASSRAHRRCMDRLLPDIVRGEPLQELPFVHLRQPRGPRLARLASRAPSLGTVACDGRPHRGGSR